MSFSELFTAHDECDDVHHLNASLQCDFVVGSEDCHTDEQYLAYTTFVYCAFGSGQTAPALAVLAFGLLIMFVGLGITADDFLTPSLIVISDSLHLSQNIAGVTFLAFGNGAPDILSSLAGIQQARPELVIGELFGAGIFVTCVVAGSVYLTQDFNVMERPFLRDVIFYIGATFWAFFLFYTQRITLAHSIGFIILYIMFILVVVLGRLVYQRMAKAEQEKPATDKAPGVTAAPKGLLQKLREGLCPVRAKADGAGDEQKKSGMFDNNAPDAYEGVVLRRALQRGSMGAAKTGHVTNPPAFGPSRCDDCQRAGSRLPDASPALAVDNELSDGTKTSWFSFRESTSHRPRRRTMSGVNLHHHRRNSIYIITTGEGEREARVRSRTRSGSGGRRSRAASVASTERRRPKSESFRVQNGELAPPSPQFLSADPPNHDTTVSMEVSPIPDIVTELSVPLPPLPPPKPKPQPATETKPQLSPLRELWLHVFPIDLDEWSSKPWHAKAIELIKAPLYFILTVTTPVVDYENDKHNWCRLLNSLHCVLSPVFITLVATGGDDYVGGVPVVIIVLLVFACVAIAVFATSKYDEPPRYHWAFGYVGFLVAVAWIYVLANEVLSLLKTFGIVIGLSDAFLGMTVLAWGNSIGDYISNLSVARQGYPRMAISACYGGPLLNLLLGFGIPYTLKLAQSGGVMSLSWTTMIGILYGTITTTLVSTLVVMIILRFHVKRAFGACLVLVYVVFTIVAILIEAKVI
ncbi:mitochondrial sodium/calcium exchanger protein-like isoform X1 [Amblyomma americanum]